MQIQAGKKINDIATISDEAFVLLILQNIWQDMMKLDIDDYYRPKKVMMKATMTITMKEMKIETMKILLKSMLQKRRITIK